MIRLFTGIDLPDSVRNSLVRLERGLPFVRWRPRENLHITLAFIGEVDGNMAREIDAELSRIRAPAFDLRLKGTGQFGKERPHTLWAGIEDPGGLTHLAAKVATALGQIGVKLEKRKFIPHVTLAYVKDLRPAPINAFVARHSDYATEPFHVGGFSLYQSHLGKGASHYVVRADYDLVDLPVVSERASS